MVVWMCTILYHMYFIEFLVRILFNKVNLRTDGKITKFYNKNQTRQRTSKTSSERGKEFGQRQKDATQNTDSNAEQCRHDSFDNDKKIMKTSTFRLFFYKICGGATRWR